MKSKLNQEADRRLVDATQQLSPEERSNAFLTHCRLVMELYEIGPSSRLAPAGRNHENHTFR